MARARFKLGLLYDRYSERLGADHLIERLTPAPKAVNLPYRINVLEGDMPGIRFLVGTSKAGLLLFSGPRVVQLYRGTDFFGISTHAGRWFAFQRYAANGRIISFRLEGDRAVDGRTELAGLSRGVHQIDFIDGSLWIVDTYRDRLQQVPIEAIGKRWRRPARLHYPVGRKDIGRERPNHAHFNSIYRDRGVIYLVAHNETIKSRRGSELFQLDPDGAVLDRQPMGGSCCHNIGVLPGGHVTCRSVEGCVALGGEVVLSLEGFLRGLSLGYDFHIVGTSPMGPDRRQRDLGIGSIVVTNPGFQPIATARLQGTQVLDVRRVDVPDLGLSATPRPDLEERVSPSYRVAAGQSWRAASDGPIEHVMRVPAEAQDRGGHR